MTVNLNLSPTEASVLREVLWNVGGSSQGARGQIDSVLKKLSRQNGKFCDIQTSSRIDYQRHGAIYFKENE
jgi:hypothetical protein